MLHGLHMELGALISGLERESWGQSRVTSPSTEPHRQATAHRGSMTIATTGNQHFAECQILCQVQNIGHSANRLFAECRTRQRQTHGELILYWASGTRQRKTLGKERFAECRALGKGWHSANRRQEVTVGHAVTVCRVSGPRHSAKRTAWSFE
jgi:hypothetical protein